jgi:hypothetical protein
VARLTLSELKTQVDPFRRDTKIEELEGYANLILRILDADFGRKIRRNFTTVISTTTPTITIAQSATAATVVTGTFPVTYDGQVIQLEGSNTWYSISNTVADTSFSIDSGFDGDDITAGSCEIASPRVVLDSDLVTIDNISRAGKPELGRVDDAIAIGGSLNPKTQEPTRYYEVEPTNTDDDLEIILLDYPDAVYTYTVTGSTRLTRFSGSSSRCGIPEMHEQVLITGAIWAAVTQKKGVQVGSFWKAWFEQLRKEARSSIRAGYRSGTQSNRTGDVPLAWTQQELVVDS